MLSRKSNSLNFFKEDFVDFDEFFMTLDVAAVKIINNLFFFLSFVKIKFFKMSLFASINKKIFKLFIWFIKYCSIFLFKLGIEITASDNKIFYFYRFFVYYILRSNSNRLLILTTTENTLDITSITDVFKRFVWSEREVWDIFGIYFFGHSDLRRLLTDYRFNRFPLQKDFPVIGFNEVIFDELFKQVSLIKIEIQYLRNYFTQLNLIKNVRIFSSTIIFQQKLPSDSKEAENKPLSSSLDIKNNSELSRGSKSTFQTFSLIEFLENLPKKKLFFRIASIVVVWVGFKYYNLDGFISASSSKPSIIWPVPDDSKTVPGATR
jgi:NADH:ubiquinone oxidoreductase subunit C